MNRFTVFLAVTTLSTALLSPGVVQAIEIQKFDRLADADQDEYVAGLVVGARRY